MTPTILLVEDEAALITLLRYNLEKEGFRLVEAHDGEEALVVAKEEQADLILLDWMLPLLSGLHVCRPLRRGPTTQDTPIILLTARSEESDKVRGLESGADDYITKPFSPAELLARVRAVLRRAAPAATADEMSFEDLTMDLTAHRVKRGDRDLHLEPTEFSLLRHFLQQPSRIFSREALLDAVSRRAVYVVQRTWDVPSSRLRKALNDGGLPDLIRTVRSAGYALDRAA